MRNDEPKYICEDAEFDAIWEQLDRIVSNLKGCEAWFEAEYGRTALMRALATRVRSNLKEREKLPKIVAAVGLKKKTDNMPESD